MRAFARTSKSAQQATSARSATSGQSRLGPRVLQTHSENPEVGATAAASPGFEHDFSQVPVIGSHAADRSSQLGTWARSLLRAPETRPSDAAEQSAANAAEIGRAS